MPVCYYAGAYWSARPESAESCARRSATLMRTLEQCDSLLTGWFSEAETYEEMLQNPVTPDYEGFLRLARLSEKERQENEDEGDGFVMGVYTRHEDDYAGGSVLISCGDTSGIIINKCLVGLPTLEGNPDGQRNPEHLRVARQVQELLDAKELLRPMNPLPGQR